MTAHALPQVRPLTAAFIIIVMALLTAAAVVPAVALLRPAYLLIVLSGVLVLVPVLIVRDARAYWLFLLVLSLPLDIRKHATSWLVRPPDLVREFGLPATGTMSIAVYLTDLVLAPMLLSWLARLALHRDKLYFPKVGYIFLLYLAVSLINSLISAPSLYLAAFELYREGIYFLLFLYIANNVVTSMQFKAIVLALFVGLAAASASVIVFFDFGIGPESYAYSWLYNQSAQVPAENDQRETGYEVTHTAYGTKRSSGFFAHPAHAAYYLEYLLPLTLAYLVTARRTRDRLLMITLLAAGSLALYLTFARSGLVGFAFGFVVFLAMAAWSRMISKQTLVRCVAVLAITTAATAPFLIYSFSARDTISKRIELIREGLTTFAERPFFGAGLNNSSAVVEGSIRISTTARGPETRVEVIHNHYLVMLIEVGIVGCILFFSFFFHIVWTALQYMKKAEGTMKLLLVGIVSALAAIAVHNFGDPFGGHVVVATLWLYAG